MGGFFGSVPSSPEGDEAAEEKLTERAQPNGDEAGNEDTSGDRDSRSDEEANSESSEGEKPRDAETPAGDEDVVADLSDILNLAEKAISEEPVEVEVPELPVETPDLTQGPTSELPTETTPEDDKPVEEALDDGLY